jgi:hypothetical protein
MKLLRKLSYLLHRRQIDAELTEEIEHHGEISGDRRAMGNMDQAFRDSRAVWAWPWLGHVRAWHRLWRGPWRAAASRGRRLLAIAKPRFSSINWAAAVVLVAVLLGWPFLTGTPLTLRTELTLVVFYTIIERTRRVERESESEGKAPRPKRVFVEDSEAVLHHAKLTGFESIGPFNPYREKWMWITGEFEGAAESLQHDAIHASLLLEDGRRLNLRFPMASRERLARLKAGRRITAIGQIPLFGPTFRPENCELVRVEPARLARRLTLAS